VTIRLGQIGKLWDHRQIVFDVQATNESGLKRHHMIHVMRDAGFFFGRENASLRLPKFAMTLLAPRLKRILAAIRSTREIG